MQEFRCAAASAAEDEPMAATAPTEQRLLLVEYTGGWGAKPPKTTSLAPDVIAALKSFGAERIQLIRRPGGGRASAEGWRVVAADYDGARWGLRTRLIDDHADLVALATGSGSGWDATSDWDHYDGALWLVCTHGRRDVCCAERGRPVAAALAQAYPDGTWETSHLGGHRFAATLLDLPSGWCLGRIDPARAVEIGDRLRTGEVPAAQARGRAGIPAAWQAAELALRERYGLWVADHIRATGAEPSADPDHADGLDVAVDVLGETRTVRVVVSPGEPVRASCGDLATKPPPRYAVTW